MGGGVGGGGGGARDAGGAAGGGGRPARRPAGVPPRVALRDCPREPEHQHAHEQVAARRHEHRIPAPEHREQHVGGQEARDGGADRVDAVEEADALADALQPAVEVRHEDRQRGAHQHRRHAQQREHRRRHLPRRAVERRAAHGVDQGQAHDAEQADADLADEEQERRPVGVAVREEAPDERADAQPEHEQRDDDRDRLDVHAERREQRPLPDDLVDQRREAGDEEQEREPPERGEHVGAARGGHGGDDRSRASQEEQEHDQRERHLEADPAEHRHQGGKAAGRQRDVEGARRRRAGGGEEGTAGRVQPEHRGRSQQPRADEDRGQRERGRQRSARHDGVHARRRPADEPDGGARKPPPTGRRSGRATGDRERGHAAGPSVAAAADGCDQDANTASPRCQRRGSGGDRSSACQRTCGTLAGGARAPSSSSRRPHTRRRRHGPSAPRPARRRPRWVLPRVRFGQHPAAATWTMRHPPVAPGTAAPAAAGSSLGSRRVDGGGSAKAQPCGGLVGANHARQRHP